tara:strand:- start:6769 stop:7995 length:1227 start_codon:yes stop_codon:yes gene_type:complete
MDEKRKKNDVNVDEIMDKIRETIKKKKELGVYSETENKRIFESHLMTTAYLEKHEDDVQCFLAGLSSICDPRKNRPITSHRPLLGSVVVFIKKSIRKVLDICLVKNVLLSTQAEFNLQLIKLLDAIIIRSHKPASNSSLQEIRQENALMKQRLERIITELEKNDNLSRESIENLVSEKKHLMDYNYLTFEKKFRGKEEDIKKRFEVYAPFFKGAINVLDIGCGRGEFLEIMRNENVSSIGIDTNEDMVYLCKQKKINVEQADALTYLSSAEDDSFGGIFASHIIEHFHYELLVEFVKLCQAKLKNGAPIVFETPNPLSLVVSATNFYLDLSHVKPIHPEAAKFLLESHGFKDVQIKFLSPFPDGMKLKKIDDRQFLKADYLRLINDNAEKLNQTLFGFQDYAVIGKKK